MSRWTRGRPEETFSPLDLVSVLMLVLSTGIPLVWIWTLVSATQVWPLYPLARFAGMVGAIAAEPVGPAGGTWSSGRAGSVIVCRHRYFDHRHSIQLIMR